MCSLTDFYTLAIRRAVVFDTRAHARARGIVLMHFLHNIFMLVVDIGSL